MLLIPKSIEKVMQTLQQAGYQAYIVGGCVRDLLLGRKPNDYDVTTSARPEEVSALFAKTLPTGLKHGTVTVMIQKEPVEITTFRTDGDYLDCRRPEKVAFVSDLKEDLARRDFTVNAIAYNPADGIRDYFNGIRDLEEKRLCAVGDPQKRFSEDALRILRLFRFASQLDFQIDPATFEAAIALSGSLQRISAERIFAELQKALAGHSPEELSPLITCGGLAFLGIGKLPDFSMIRRTDDPMLSLFLFLKGSTDDIPAALDRLKASNRQKSVCAQLSLLDTLPLESRAELKEALYAASPETVRQALILRNLAGTPTLARQRELSEILESEEPYTVGQLKINGGDVSALGYTGRQVGEMLEYLRKKVVVEPSLNRKQTLLNLIKKP